MRPRRSCSLVLVLALACCTRPPAEQLKTELQTAASWAATARLAGEAWLKGSVPRAYAVQTFRVAAETLEDEAQTIQGQQAEEATGLTRAAGATIGRMRAAVAGGDRQALAQLLGQLGGEEQALRSLAGGARP